MPKVIQKEHAKVLTNIATLLHLSQHQDTAYHQHFCKRLLELDAFLHPLRIPGYIGDHDPIIAHGISIALHGLDHAFSANDLAFMISLNRQETEAQICEHLCHILDPKYEPTDFGVEFIQERKFFGASWVVMAGVTHYWPALAMDLPAMAS